MVIKRSVAKFSLLPFAPICYTANMNPQNVLQGAQNVVITASNINVADSVSELSDAPYHKLIS